MQEYLFLQAFPGFNHNSYVDTPTHAREMLWRIHAIYQRKRRLREEDKGEDGGPKTL